MLLNLKRLTCALVLALLTPLSAQADVWGYIDAKGVAHFAAEKLDDRYELFFKGNTGFDTKEGVNPAGAKDAPEPETPRSVAVPSGKSKLLAFFEVSPNFKAVRHHMRESAQAYNIDFELLQALIATESGFDTQAVSPKGAVGLMQLMPPTAQRYGVRGDATTPIEKKLTDPKTNIRAGSRYLARLINLVSRPLDLALAAYNAGEGAVQRYGNKIPPFKETQNYVVTVMQIYRQLKRLRRSLRSLPRHKRPIACAWNSRSKHPAKSMGRGQHGAAVSRHACKLR
ncbi:MAG: lytic transglycosylase domain-containing protein [Brachymonas sp.]|nr:lytic transglycosylase domain-containing protein [Brachymonas sp.]